MEKEINPKEITSFKSEKPKSKLKLLLAWVLLGLAIVYGISPIDIIPDYPLVGIGWLDDLSVFGIALYNLYKRIKESRA